jgi:hypothetical protein
MSPQFALSMAAATLVAILCYAIHGGDHQGDCEIMLAEVITDTQVEEYEQECGGYHYYE